MDKGALDHFSDEQIAILTDATAMAEDIVINHYKMSSNEWSGLKYDIKTLAHLYEAEIVHGPFAQVIRYAAQHKGRLLPTSTYDFYKICLQDHNIISILNRFHEIELFPFALFIVTHELVHVVRFCRFLQSFDASPDEKLIEEKRVHELTRIILSQVGVQGLPNVLNFADHWRSAIDYLS